MSKINDLVKELVEELKVQGGILIGSYALGVNKDSSDIDIAVTDQILNDALKNCDINPEVEFMNYDIRNYFKVLPINNVRLIKVVNPNAQPLDIIVMEDCDMKTIQESIDVVGNVPVEFLKDKGLRVSLFEAALLNRGFKPSVEYEELNSGM